jgi:thiol-disulfide isomerase/thioredoxin
MNIKTISIFILGLACGALLSILIMRLTLSHSYQQEKPIQNISTAKPTITDVRASLNAPQMPIMVATGSIIDFKNTQWQLRGINNTVVSFADLRGKVMFINFWATWCGPCVAEMPSIQALYDSLKHDPVEFLAISDESISKIQEFGKHEQLTLPLFQSMSKPLPEFDFKVWPVTVIVNKSGTIVYINSGSARWDDPSVIKFIRNLCS